MPQECVRFSRTGVCLLSLLLLGAPAAADAAPAVRDFAVRDLLSMQRLGEPALSADGRLVAFVVRTIDLEANASRADLWLVQSDGSGLRRLTTHPAGDFSPCFAPDGRQVYFLSTRSGRSQVWRIAVAGGEAEPVTDLPLDVEHLALSPDGRTLAVSLMVFADCPDLACTVERLREQEARKASGRLYERLFVRHWDTWKDGRRRHVFAVPVAGGAPVDLMRGMDADAPTQPWGGVEELAFAPDSRGLVFVAKNAGRQEAWSTNTDLFYAPLDGNAAPRNLTPDNPAADTAPAFSPDGKTLALLSMTRPGFEADRQRIRLLPWPAGNARTLTEAWDRSPGEIVWAPAGDAILAAADHLGQHSLFAVSARTGEARELVRDGTNAAVRAAGANVVFLHDSLQGPAEVWTCRPNGSGARALTHFNDERLSALRLGAAEQFTFVGAHGDTVMAYLVKPANFDPGRRYPIAFLVHGGPQGSFGNHFHYRWNPQVYAGAGYAAVMVDFHGSTGYGQAFTDAIRHDWGGAPYEDLMKGLDAALARYPFLDGQRAAALGASYGGYMIYWIAGQTDRFRCLVAHDGNLDERFAYFDTEELWFPEWEHGGTPWDNPSGYAKHNPIEFVGNWKTPTLVVHGELDFRVVATQGLAAFNALQRRGIPSQFLWFPDENHWVLKPQNSLQWHETVLAWLGRWTAP